MKPVMKPSTFRRLAGMVMVFTYLLACPSVVPAALGLLAHHADHDHELQFAAVDNGFDLTLHHHHDDEAAVEDSTSAGKTRLAAEDDDDGPHGDHVFQFKSLSRLPDGVAAKAMPAAPVAVLLSWQAGFILSPWSQAAAGKLLRARPPPDVAAHARIIETTVFLV